jgi:hypothetical protein
MDRIEPSGPTESVLRLVTIAMAKKKTKKDNALGPDKRKQTTIKESMLKKVKTSQVGQGDDDDEFQLEKALEDVLQTEGVLVVATPTSDQSSTVPASAPASALVDLELTPASAPPTSAPPIAAPESEPEMDFDVEFFMAGFIVNAEGTVTAEGTVNAEGTANAEDLTPRAWGETE